MTAARRWRVRWRALLRGLLQGRRRARRPAAAAVAVVALAAVLGPLPAARATSPGTLVLQLNLCGSGYAVCWTGRAPAEAAGVVRRQRPDVVTVNEVCEDDLPRLRRALASGGAAAVSAFAPVGDARTGGPARCRDGSRYGVAVLARGAAGTRWRTTSGTYPVQDPGQAERRVWLCLSAPARPAACTTHLSSGSPAVTLAQCRHLVGVVLPSVSTDGPVLVGGDLNLRRTPTSGLRPCLGAWPAGVADADDAVQHVLAGPGLRVLTRRLAGLRGSTDHPALLVRLARLP